MIKLSEIRDKLKPDIMGWINQAIASATLSGITISLPSNVAYLDVDQVFTASQTFSAETNVNVITTAVDETHAALTSVYWANPASDDTLGFAIGSWNFGIIVSGNVNDFNNVVGALTYGQHYGSGTVANVTGVGALATLEENGIITLARGVNARVDNNGSGTITTAEAIRVENAINGGGGSIGKLAGIEIIEQTTGTNNTNLAIGSIPTGDYSIYNASTRANHFAGSLVVAAHSAFGSSGAVVSTDASIFINETFATTNGVQGIYSQANYNPGSNSSNTIVGVSGVGNVTNGNIRDINGVFGVNAVGIHDGTGTVTALFGSSGIARNSNSGTVTSARGIRVRVENDSTGTITAGYGVYIDTFENGGGGTFTGAAGIAMADMAVGTNKTNLLLGTTTIPSGTFNIYSSSTLASYFAGNIGINTATFPTSLAGGMAFGNGTAASASLTDGIGLWAADFSAGDSRLYARYEAMSAGAPIAVLGLAQSWTAVQTFTATPVISSASTAQLTLTKTGTNAGSADIHNDGALNIVSNSAVDETYYRAGAHGFYSNNAGTAFGRISATGIHIGADSNSASALEIDAMSNTGYITMTEITAPSAAAANGARIFVRDNGAGKTQVCVIFNTGAIQVMATQP